MITSFELNFDVLSEMVGVVVEKKDPAPKEGETLKLFIPKLMPNIDKSIPVKSSNFINKGSKLFLNSSECRPRCRVLLKTQNYLTGYLEKNCEWNNVSNSKIGYRKLQNTDGYSITASAVDYYGRDISIKLYENYKSYYTVGGEKVNCYAPNGKISKLLFNNDKYM